VSLIYLNEDFNLTVERILSDNELSNCGLGKRKVSRTLKAFDGDEIASSVFLKKYALRDENNNIIEFTLGEAKDRWANCTASAEKLFNSKNIAPPEYFRELYNYFLPGGRQMFALGNDYIKKATFTNCYVTKIEDDSIEGIFDAAKRIAKTYSYGGGIGLCIGELRPADSKVSNSAKFSTGAASFMELYSLTTGLIGQFGRRGALMITIPVSHPDVENFIDMKHGNINKVKYANISIKLTDDFMNAVINNESFELFFETRHEKISRTIKARDLWNKIVQSARDSAEPGLLFWDRMVEMSPSDTYDRLKVHATNPCGEEILEPGGTCVLGSLLLHSFVRSPYTEQAEFDMDLFQEMVKRAVRHLDNVIELNMGKHGLEEQEEASKLGRRVGLGVTGLADMIAALGDRYDSDDALGLVGELMNLKKNIEYHASVKLAKERGSFPLFDPDKHFERGFAATLDEDIKASAKTDGLRNVALSTIAPSGSLSIVAQCSSGIEPIFASSYIRFVEMGVKEKKKFRVYHPGLVRYFDITKTQELPDWWVTAHGVDYKYRVKLQGALQKHIDASISSTINLPADVDTKTVGDIYIEAWKEGLKGVTVYREGSREGILITDEFAQAAGMPNLDTIVYCIKAEGGDKFYTMISYKDGDIKRPYQVFVMNYRLAERDHFVKIGNALIRMLREKGVSEKRIQKYISRSNNSLAKLTRFLSLSMKTDNLPAAVSILDEHAFAGTLASKLHEILKKSIEIKGAICRSCKSSNVKMEEGCMVCLDCTWSGCS
jgi:ribonucleoside-diphosphate reductase alpha chain